MDSEIKTEDTPKVREKYKKRLEKIDIFNVEDLLYYFPTKYEALGRSNRPLLTYAF